MRDLLLNLENSNIKNLKHEKNYNFEIEHFITFYNNTL
jgi:hypothetical protein